MRNLLLATALVTPICFLQMGCQTPTSSNQMEGDSAGDRRNIQDADFAGRIEILEKRMVTTDDGFLLVHVTIRNNGKGAESFETMFEWFDDKGMKVDSNVESWLPGTVYGNEKKQIKGIGPTRAATRFLFHVRRPNSIVSSTNE